MANSVDPDKTAPMSSLIWVCTVCSHLSVDYKLSSEWVKTKYYEGGASTNSVDLD